MDQRLDGTSGSGRLSSKAFLNRFSAAAKAGSGGGSADSSAGTVPNSPIITLDASLLLLLGELVSRAGSTAVERRSRAGRPEPRRDPERRSRAAAARLLAALNS